MWFLPTGQTATLPWRVSDYGLDWGREGRGVDLVEGLGAGQCMLFCNMRRWEILTRPLPSPHRRPLPLTKGIYVYGHLYVCVHVFHPLTRAHQFLPIWQSLVSSILVYNSPFPLLSVSVGSQLSAGSQSCTRSKPSLLFRSRIICPPQGEAGVFLGWSH